MKRGDRIRLAGVANVLDHRGWIMESVYKQGTSPYTCRLDDGRWVERAGHQLVLCTDPHVVDWKGGIYHLTFGDAEHFANPVFMLDGRGAPIEWGELTTRKPCGAKEGDLVVIDASREWANGKLVASSVYLNHIFKVDTYLGDNLTMWDGAAMHHRVAPECCRVVMESDLALTLKKLEMI